MISAYSGKFLDGKMISGQESKITDLLHENGVVVPIFDELKGPVFNHITFDQETLIGGLTPDPLEERYVYVNYSKTGLGIFQKKSKNSKKKKEIHKFFINFQNKFQK